MNDILLLTSGNYIIIRLGMRWNILHVYHCICHTGMCAYHMQISISYLVTAADVLRYHYDCMHAEIASGSLSAAGVNQS